MTDTAAERKPHDDEIDLWGLTHPGIARASNEDHFLIGTLHKRLDIRATSLPNAGALPSTDERLGSIAMVADGVGGEAAGEEASRIALEEVTRYVTESTGCYYVSDAQAEQFLELLHAAAMRSHERVVERARERTDARGMATTLTLFIVTWPWLYLLQVGDSRYYLHRDGALRQLTRDQTVAEELIDLGAMARPAALASQWANVLSSSLGGGQTAPVVTRIRTMWQDVHLLCSDGLTKHVSDEQIAHRLATMTSARQACEALLQDALDGGGSDNITVVVGRATAR